MKYIAVDVILNEETGRWVKVTTLLTGNAAIAQTRARLKFLRSFMEMEEEDYLPF